MLYLKRGVRLQYDKLHRGAILLFPEGLVELNAPAHEVLRRLPKARSDLHRDLRVHYGTEQLDGLDDFLEHARASKWVVEEPRGD
jgi:coenzyme PQQ biosynthesis protein PqqD